MMIWWIVVALLVLLIFIFVEFNFWLDGTLMRLQTPSDFNQRRLRQARIDIVEAMSDEEIITILNQHINTIHRAAYKDATIYYTPPHSVNLIVWANRLRGWVEAIEDMKGMNADDPDYEYYFERYSDSRGHAKSWIIEPYYTNLRPSFNALCEFK